MESFADFFAKALSVTTMLSLGLNTTKHGLKMSLNWRTLAAPVFLSLVVLPILAFFLLWLLGEKNDLVTLGLTIAVASGGGSSAGIFIKGVRGSESISGALVVVQALISSVSLPVLLGTAFTKSPVPASMFQLVEMTVLYQVLPFAAGFGVNRFSLKVERLSAGLSKVNSAALLLLIAGLAFQSFDQFKYISDALWITVIAINMLAFFGPYTFFEVSQSLLPTISISVGIRNLTMALLIISAFETTAKVTAPILVYGLFMYIFAGLRLVFHLKKASEPT